MFYRKILLTGIKKDLKLKSSISVDLTEDQNPIVNVMK